MQGEFTLVAQREIQAIDNQLKKTKPL